MAYTLIHIHARFPVHHKYMHKPLEDICKQTKSTTTQHKANTFYAPNATHFNVSFAYLFIHRKHRDLCVDNFCESEYSTNPLWNILLSFHSFILCQYTYREHILFIDLSNLTYDWLLNHCAYSSRDWQPLSISISNHTKPVNGPIYIGTSGTCDTRIRSQ